MPPPWVHGPQKRVGHLCSRSAHSALGQGGEGDSVENCVSSRVKSGVSLLHRVCTADNEFRLGNLGRLPGGGGTEEQQQREDVPGGRSSDERKHAGSPRRSGRLQAQGGSVLSQPKFRSRRLGVHGTPDTPWTLIFNPLSVYLLSREGRP